PSGSGKSTLMKILYREEIQTQGKVVVGKYHLNRLKPKDVPMLRRQVGVIFQDFKLLPSLTAYENVAYAMEVTGKSRKEIKKRVSIARAIVNRPRIIVAEEPTGNLDPENAIEIFRLLERINQNGTTVLMGTHNDHLVNEFKHRLIRLEKGNLVRDEYEGEYNEKH